jgi:DNA-binding helix-hairpin-helix protein with protein kinase domain
VAVGGVRFTTVSGAVVVPGRRLAAGGQGEVFTVSAGQVFKRYFPAALDSDPSLERRLRAVAGHAPAGWREPGGHLALAWPAEVVLGDGRFAGFLMPAVDMTQTVGLHRITNPTDRQAATGMTAWAPR